MRFILLLLLVFIFPSESQATTLRVEKDGSADFNFLQGAADAAASGDTILVGPGRFHQWEIYYEISSILYYTTPMLIDSKDLLIIGESDGSTIVGPLEPWIIGTPWHHGIVVFSNSRVEVRNIVFNNLDGAIMSWASGETVVFDCSFVDNDRSVFCDGGIAHIQDCSFSVARDGTHINSYFQARFSMDNCLFEHVIPNWGYSINISGVIDGSIDNCRFVGSFLGLQADRGGRTTIRNSIFRENYYAAHVGLGAEVEFLDCAIEQPAIGFLSYLDPYTLKVERTTIEDAGIASVVSNHLRLGYVRDCILSKGDRGVVLYYPHLFNPEPNNSSFDPVMLQSQIRVPAQVSFPVSPFGGLDKSAREASTWNDRKGLASNPGAHDKTPAVIGFDMTDNFWGTSNPDSIQAWIDDYVDDPVVPFKIIWEPYKDQPVSTSKRSLGNFKSLFR